MTNNSKFKSIVFLTNIPTPYRSAFFNELSVACENAGQRLHVIYCAHSEPARHWKLELDNFQHSHSFPSGLHASFRGMSFHFNPPIFSEIRRRSPDFLICAGAWNMPSVWLGLLATAFGDVLRIFWSEGHVDAVRHPDGPVADLRRRVLCRFDGFAVPNRRSADWATEQTGSPRALIRLPNTVDEGFYLRSGPDERPAARQALRIDPATRVLVQVSQLEPKKGVIELAEAYAGLPREVTAGSQLVIVGEGALRENLKRIAATVHDSAQLLITGHLGRLDVRRWLMAADLFVLNSFRDPNPLAPVEASFAGLPLLVSRRAGNHDEMIEQGAGMTIENPTHPTHALEKMLKLHSGALIAMGQVAMKNAVQRFARKAVVRNFLDDLTAIRNSRT